MGLPDFDQCSHTTVCQIQVDRDEHMKIHLVDGTYELFRAHFGAPPKQARWARVCDPSEQVISQVTVTLEVTVTLAKLGL